MRLNPIMHRSTRTAIAVVLFSSAWWGQEAAVAASGTLAITDVTLIDCTGRPAQPHVTVVVVDGRIAAVTPADRAQVPDGAESVSGTKRFLIPGLHDMHLHLGDYAEGKQALPILVANGITGVRDMGSPLDDILRLRNETASGMLLGPRMVVAGPLVQGPLPFQMPLLLSVKDETTAREAVSMLQRRGVDFIKVQDALPRRLYFAILDEARRKNISVAGHIPPTVLAAEVSDAGQASIEHLGGRFFGVLVGCSREGDALHKVAADLYGAILAALERKEEPPKTNMKAAFSRRLADGYSEPKAMALFDRFVRNGTWQCPTLVSLKELWESDSTGLTAEDLRAGSEVYEKEVEVIRGMRRAGVRFLAGTDLSPRQELANLHDELSLLVEAGFTPMEALQTATSNAAQFSGRLREEGTVEEGKVADLVLLEADPLQDIAATRRIVAVILGGRFIPKPRLEEMRAPQGKHGAAQQ